MPERARRKRAPRDPITDVIRLVDGLTRIDRALGAFSELAVATRSANFSIPPTDTAASLPRIGSVQR